MKLEQVTAKAAFDAAVRQFQSQFPKGSTVHNCYLLPDKIAAVCREGRMFCLPQSDSAQLAFLSDEGAFYRLYLYLHEPQQLQLNAADKPLLVEVMYTEHACSSQIQQLQQALVHVGFHLHKQNQQYCAALEDAAILQEKAAAAMRDCRLQGVTVAAAQADDLEEIFALWKRCIDPYAFVYTSQSQWLQEAEAGRLLCLKDRDGHIAAAQQYSVERKRSQESHISVAPEYRGKGLARVLLTQWQYRAALAGCRNAVCWIAQDNIASQKLHGSFSKLQKISAQYVRES